MVRADDTDLTEKHGLGICEIGCGRLKSVADAFNALILHYVQNDVASQKSSVS